MANYKTSKYNFFFETKSGEKLAYNALSGGFALVKSEDEEKVKDFIRNPNKEIKGEKEKEIFEALKKGRFIAPEYFDEIGVLKVRFWSSRFNSRDLGLTILPTLNCNFKCIYCYEREKDSISGKKMSDKKAKALVDFVSKQLSTGIKSLSVTWYGGEPLLEYGRIKDLSSNIQKLCEKKGVTYVAGIITNGYLLRPGIFDELTEMKISSIQITLDGSPEIHNKFRPLVDGSPTFSKILENLKRAAEYGKFEIDIRVNISKDNPSAPKDLAHILEKEGLKDKITIYPGQIISEKEDLKSTCFSNEMFSDISADFLEYLMTNKWRIHPPNSVKGTYCSGYVVNSYGIDPLLNLYKCWDQVGIDLYKIGHLDENGNTKLNWKNQYWLSYDLFEIEECRSCKYLPLCMGGCLAKSMKDMLTQGEIGKGECTVAKFNLLKRLEIYFKYVQENATKNKETTKDTTS